MKNLGAIFKLFSGMLRKGFEGLPAKMSVYNAFIQANLGRVKVYITRSTRLNGGAILAPYQITRGSLPSIVMTQTTSRLTKSSVNIGTLAIDDTTTIGQLATAISRNLLFALCMTALGILSAWLTPHLLALWRDTWYSLRR